MCPHSCFFLIQKIKSIVESEGYDEAEGFQFEALLPFNLQGAI
jgi:hypothetical protein